MAGKIILNEQNILYQKLKTYIEVIDFNVGIEQQAEKAIKDFKLYPMVEQTLIDLSTDN